MEPVSYRCGDFHVDGANRRFSCRGTEIPLEPRTFSVILQLLARSGSLVTRNELLDAVWGHRYVTPSTLNRVIVLARRAFGDDTAEPRHIVTVHGAGYRYTGPCEREEPASADRPVRFSPPATARLPARVDTLIGREGELVSLGALLGSHREVTVLGPGGIGKTQCALEMARRIAPDYPDGVWFFDLAPLARAGDWLRALAAALEIRSDERGEILAQVAPLLQGRRALLVLDNCDRLAAELGALVIAILRGTDALKIVSTSQAPLSFKGEQLLRLPPLALPAALGSGQLSVPEIAAAPAVEMLVTRVRAVQPGFALSESNAPAILDICRRLDGMPLALELAAARFALLSPEQVLDRLDQRFHFLRASVAGRDGRHQNLQLLLDWSFGLLSAEEQRLLRWSAVFVQTWTVEAAIELAAALGHSPEAAVDLLTGLVDKSLVAVVPGLMPPRYRLLETVREYALERLRAAGEESQARHGHVGLMVRMAEAAHADMIGGRMRERVDQLLHEHGNIGSAIDFALGEGANPVAALRIVGALTLYLKASGSYSVGYRWARRVVAATGAASAPQRGRALLCLGVILVHTGEEDDLCGASLLEAAQIAHRNQDPWSDAYANGFYTLWLCNSGRFAEAGPHLAALERIGGELDDALLQGMCGLARGWVQMAANDYSAAVATLRAVRDLGPDLHQRHFIDIYIGLALFALGENAAAARQFLDSLHNAAEVSNLRGVAGSIEACGYLAARFAEWADAARLLALARRIREQTGVPLLSFWVPYHNAAYASLRSALALTEYEAQSAAGERMRYEDAASEVRARLALYSNGATNTPLGS